MAEQNNKQRWSHMIARASQAEGPQRTRLRAAAAAGCLTRRDSRDGMLSSLLFPVFLSSFPPLCLSLSLSLSLSPSLHFAAWWLSDDRALNKDLLTLGDPWAQSKQHHNSPWRPALPFKNGFWITASCDGPNYNAYKLTISPSLFHTASHAR